MATINELYKVALENREALNRIEDEAKETEDYNPAGTLVDSDLVRISRGGESLKTTVGDIKAASGGGDDNVQSDWNQTDQLADDYIKNKPLNLSDFNNDLPESNVTADAYSHLQTGLISGGEITVNAGNNATVDVAAGTGIVMDWTNPANPIPIHEYIDTRTDDYIYTTTRNDSAMRISGYSYSQSHFPQIPSLSFNNNFQCNNVKYL